MLGTISIRERIIDEAALLTAEQGWSNLTMSQLANQVGVSRQTVYNEIGGKTELAQSMILHELAKFLELVDHAFDSDADLSTCINDAVLSVLTMAKQHSLLHAILSATHGINSDLLPFLTTDSQALIEAAAAVVKSHLTRFDIKLSATELDTGVDMIVRLILSNMLYPHGTPKQIAGEITWVSMKVLS